MMPSFRLPIFQGAATEYVIPLLIIANEDSSFCSTMSVQNKNSGKSMGIALSQSMKIAALYNVRFDNTLE